MISNDTIFVWQTDISDIIKKSLLPLTLSIAVLDELETNVNALTATKSAISPLFIIVNQWDVWMFD